MENTKSRVFNIVQSPAPSGWGMVCKGNYEGEFTASEIFTACGIYPQGVPLMREFGNGAFKFTYSYD